MHVIDAHPPYHVLLGLPWIHRAVPSTYFQCIKALIRAVPVHIDAVSLPFEEHETYFMDASFYGRKKDEEMLEQEEKENSKKANRYRKVKRLSQLARLAVLFLMATSNSSATYLNTTRANRLSLDLVKAK